MPHAHRRNRLLFAVLMVAGTRGPASMGQDAPMPATPPAAPAFPGPPAMGPGMASPLTSTDGTVLEPGQPAAPMAPGPAGGCTCGNRRGVSRWWWHRSRCKRHMQEHFLGYAEEFNEWPLGSSLYAHAQTQIGNGAAARMVFYHYDFLDGTSQLNTRGRDKLAAVAASLPTSFLPVVVERTPKEPGLDQSRKDVLLAELGRGSFPVPSERILIGPPVSYGMTGYESYFAIYPRQIGNLASGGAIGGAGATGFVGGGLDFNAGGLSGGAVGGLGAVGR